jgi:hypothetical protein
MYLVGVISSVVTGIYLVVHRRACKCIQASLCKLYAKLHDAFKHQEGKMVSSASSAICIMLGMLMHLLFQSATEADRH